MAEANHSVIEKPIDPILIAGIRMKGRYQDCGKGFARLGRQFGRHICGKPMMLCYDSEYRENDADYEVCFPVRSGDSTDDITVRELPGGVCLALMHHGPYDTLRDSYAVLCEYIEEHGLQIESPTREVYLKGPGMIFRGNPKKYRTELQFLLATRNPTS